MGEDKVSFGNRNQPFFELSPLYPSRFEMLNREWNSLMHFWVINSYLDIKTQEVLFKIRSIDELLKTSYKIGGTVHFEEMSNEVFLRSIHESFIQDEHRALILMSTGSAELIYNAPKSYLTENNRYGRILMRMRHIIAEELK